MTNSVSTNNNRAHTVTPKQRIAEIDVAKAIGIICVIIGHGTTGVIHNYIYLFHMPLFFILSGYMIKGEKLSFRQMLIKENKLMSSYLIYSFIFIIIDCLRNPGSYSFLANVMNTCTLYGIHPLWFISSLWIAKLTIRILEYISNSILRHVAVIAIYVAGYGVSLLLVDSNYSGVIETIVRFLAWSLVRSGVILIFVYLGYSFKSYLALFLAFLKKRLILCVFFILLTGFLLVPFIQFEAVDYALLHNGLFILNVVYGIIGTLLILSISILISNYSKIIKPLFMSIGKNSVHYMAAEYLSFLGCVKALLDAIIPSFSYFPYIVQYASPRILYLVLLYFVIWLLGPLVNKCIDSLTGKLNSICR